MNKDRLEAFSDGVLAIIITVMVLELKVPRGTGWSDLVPVVPTLLSYVLSFIYVGIYWNNHHHLFQAARQINGAVMWANLHLLFWLSLVPFVTAWAGENYFSNLPVALYGFTLMMAGVAYFILAQCLIAGQGRESVLAKAVGKDSKGKISVALYALSIVLAFCRPWMACLIYVVVAGIWLKPDSRIEKKLTESKN